MKSQSFAAGAMQQQSPGEAWSAQDDEELLKARQQGLDRRRSAGSRTFSRLADLAREYRTLRKGKQVQRTTEYTIGEKLDAHQARVSCVVEMAPHTIVLCIAGEPRLNYLVDSL